jgi:hypothetical protein
VTAYHLLIAASAVVAYGISSAIQVELRNGRRMTAVGAFGPALIALGESGYRVAPLTWLIGGALGVELVALLVTRQRVRILLVHGFALLAAATLFEIVTAFAGVTGRRGLLLGTALSSVIYLTIEILKDEIPVRAARRVRLVDRLMDAAPVHSILLSTSGLTVLALPLLRWVTFPIVLVPLLAAAHEFGNFGKTKRTFDETVKGLASLVEGAGYAPDGHHERVAALCVAMARYLGLSSKQVRELELVALVHDIGAVSMPDPQSLTSKDNVVVAERSAEFVEETGYLAGHGSTLRRAVRGAPEGIEASILCVANAYDELRESQAVDSRTLDSTLASVNPEVVRAFRAVVTDARNRPNG